MGGWKKGEEGGGIGGVVGGDVTCKKRLSSKYDNFKQY